ncbi:MAG: TIGR03936 family radical SAM-associated protein [Spirochaetes bacterium]|nr:TIGR03936 family radical SAM-associated protein [Spirochaetota bacterium]
MNSLTDKQLEEILHYIFKPGQYIGKEINSVTKKWDKKTLKVALCYPDLYEIGMANYSIRILYELVNNSSNLLLERVFLPEEDMQKAMKEKKIPLFSLESRHFINNFDVLGFTIQYELNYLPMLQILKLSGIPFSSSERRSFPLVMAGGAGLANPEPIADFIDFFLIGEADDVIIGLLKKIKAWKDKNMGRDEILRELDRIEYIFVPSLNKTITRRHIVPDLNRAYHPVKQIVPFIVPVQNRGVVEVDRGCINNCRFCQAGYYYRPKRERSMDTIIKIVDRLIKNTGYSTLTLLSLSISNYSCLIDLLKALNSRYRGQGISLSLPSIRIDAFTIDLLKQLDIVRRSGLTFALESADIDIQKMINKRIDLDNFIETLVTAARKRWKTIKIYLMIGFNKDDSEVSSIQSLIDRIITRLKQERLRITINLHVNPIAKKPLTPLETEEQIDFRIIEEKFDRLRNIFFSRHYKKWVHLKGQDIKTSFLDAILARADREISRVLLSLIQKGYYTDTGKGGPDVDMWLKTFKENGIDHEKYLYNKEYLQKVFQKERKIDFRYKEGFFTDEYTKYQSREKTGNCLDEACYNCGICNKEIKNSVSTTPAVKKERNNKKKGTQLRFKYKLTFTKKGSYKFISHRDLWDVFETIFRRISLPIVYSEGFNKRMRFSLIFTPPLMVEGEKEILELFTHKALDEEKVMRMINAVLTDKDLHIKNITRLADHKRSLNSVLGHSEYTIDMISKSLHSLLLNKIKKNKGIALKSTKDLSLTLILLKDRSVTKLLAELSSEEFPALWKKIKNIKRNRIF